MEYKLTHLDEKDKPKMVDVGNKEETQRVATASGIIEMTLLCCLHPPF